MSASTKDDIGASLSVSADMRLTMSNLIAVDMSSAGITVEHSEEDADYVICLLAFSSAEDKPTVVVADDTYVFQLLVHHGDSTNDSAELYMGTSRQIISIKTLKNSLNHSLVRSLLFVYAISGWDITLRSNGIGKVTFLSK